MRDALDSANAEAGNIAGGDPDGVAYGFPGHGAGLIRAGMAVVGAAAAGEQQTTRQRSKTR